MSTCKTFEKETLLPHLFWGARDVKMTKGGADPKKIIIITLTSTTAIWDDTENWNKKDDSAQHISSLFNDRILWRDAALVHFTPRVESLTLYLRCHWIKQKKKKPPKWKHFHESQQQFKGGTVFKSSTNTKSSISHYRRVITGWRSSTFGICFIFF